MDAKYHRALFVFENVYCLELQRIYNKVKNIENEIGARRRRIQDDYHPEEPITHVSEKIFAGRAVLERIEFVFAAIEYILAHPILLDHHPALEEEYDTFNSTCLFIIQQLLRYILLLHPPTNKRNRDMQKRVMSYAAGLNIEPYLENVRPIVASQQNHFKDRYHRRTRRRE